MVAASRNRSVNGVATFIRSTDPSTDELPRTVIDTYATWASGVTDAPEQYHRVTGAVILSTILCPYVSLDTSFGTVRPNLWAMILAGTTLTRKSTSMNLAIKVLNDVAGDYLLATDGSPEGIFSELSSRAGKVSLFHRDEITGFIAATNAKDYMSGTLESFTHLYDGTEQKRVLRGNTITVSDPLFIFFCGGIKSRMEEIVGMEHIRSGFLPRFLFVTGSTTRDQVRPIGPPPDETTLAVGEGARDKVLDDLYRINRHYVDGGKQPPSAQVKIAGLVKVATPTQANPNPSTASTTGPLHVKLEATDDAWARIRELHEDAMRMGEESSAPELYTPMFARLADSVVKVSILLAAADLKPLIERHHVQNACRLSQEWLESLLDFAMHVEEAPEMSPFEKKIDKLINFVKASSPEPVTRTAVMQKFRIRKKDIFDIEDTMVARKMITIIKEPIEGKNLRNTDGFRYYWAMPRDVADALEEEKEQQKRANTPRKKARKLIQKEKTFLGSSKGHTQIGRYGKPGRPPKSQNPNPEEVIESGEEHASEEATPDLGRQSSD